MNRPTLILAVAVVAGGGWMMFHHHPTAGEVASHPAPAQVPTAARASLPTITMPPTTPSTQPSSTPAATHTPIPTTTPIGSTRPVAKIALTGTPRGAHTPGKVDDRNPDNVAKAFLASAFTTDTAIDTSPQAGFARSAGWATSSYARYLVEAPASNPGADWLQLQAAHGWTQVDSITATTVGDAPPAVPNGTTLSYKVTVATHGTTPTSRRSYDVYVTLLKTATGTWQVNDYRQLV